LGEAGDDGWRGGAKHFSAAAVAGAGGRASGAVFITAGGIVAGAAAAAVLEQQRGGWFRPQRRAARAEVQACGSATAGAEAERGGAEEEQCEWYRDAEPYCI
jgi:hypothetical protein